MEYNAVRRRMHNLLRDNYKQIPRTMHTESELEKDAYRTCPHWGMSTDFVTSYIPDIAVEPCFQEVPDLVSNACYFR